MIRCWPSGAARCANGCTTIKGRRDASFRAFCNWTWITHHRLLKAGLSTRRVAIVLCVGNGALVIFGLLITTFTSHAAGIFLIALLVAAYVLTRHLAILELRDTGTAILRGFSLAQSLSFKKSLAFQLGTCFG